jgi:Glycosyltransferase family 28 C-terminal domain
MGPEWAMPGASWRAAAERAGRNIALAESARREGELPANPPPLAKITFVYFDAGGGHRSATSALCSVIADERRPWEIECLNFQELLDPVDTCRKLTGIRSQDVYNLMLKNGWTLGATQLLPVLHALIRLRHSQIVRLLESHWRESRPDAVVSVIPHFNRQIAESVRKALPGHPFVTILTDMADFPPHVWIERESEYLICGTERAARQALAMGHSPERVFRTSGMILNPAFYSNHPLARGSERTALGLEAGRTTGLVLFGGQGSKAMLEIARRLNGRDDLQLILIAGRNPALVRELRSIPCRIPVRVEGFTTRIPYYMHLADFFIGKPGPGSVSEALQMNLPVIVESNAWTLPQERFNAQWIKEKDVGLVVRSFRQIAQAVEPMLTPATLARFRQNALALKNRAVFEIPEILEAILERTAREAASGEAPSRVSGGGWVGPKT